MSTTLSCGTQLKVTGTIEITETVDGLGGINIEIDPISAATLSNYKINIALCTTAEHIDALNVTVDTGEKKPLNMERHSQILIPGTQRAPETIQNSLPFENPTTSNSHVNPTVAHEQHIVATSHVNGTTLPVNSKVRPKVYGGRVVNPNAIVRPRTRQEYFDEIAAALNIKKLNLGPKRQQYETLTVLRTIADALGLTIRITGNTRKLDVATAIFVDLGYSRNNLDKYFTKANNGKPSGSLTHAGVKAMRDAIVSLK